ncbi:MAG: succinylglutamate desuccinylase/aspartoacylase family protein, partial [Alphaproteobacteria bacterium]|nr:succinylglutamate desuccinylase/aspartoacylase family protein [Alphaproteobacteria bacterium]
MPVESGNDYPIELTPPDISPYKEGNTGVDYFTTFEAEAAGPHVMVTAVVHGNELCGALALDHLFRENLRPVRGKLTLGFANVGAFHSFDAAQPKNSRYLDEDFNRLWDVATLKGERDSAELTRAREIWPLVEQADFLLDIHSMQHATVPLMMAGPLPKGRALARGVGTPETVVSDAGHAAGRRLRDYLGFAEEASPRNALLIECGQHWEAGSREVAIETVYRFLGHLEAIAPEAAEPYVSKAAPAQKFIEVAGPVTIETDGFRFAENYKGLEVIAEAGTVIGHDGDKEVTTPFDDCVLIMPSQRLKKGESAVRFGRFV